MNDDIADCDGGTYAVANTVVAMPAAKSAILEVREVAA